MDHAESRRRQRPRRGRRPSWRTGRARWDLLVSSGLKRTFSSSTTSPSFIAATLARHPRRRCPLASGTSTPSSSPRRLATGARDSSGTTLPFGRPRWAIRMTLAPSSRSAVIVGSAALIRPSSVIVVPSSGTLKSARIRTRLPLRSPRSLSVFMCILSYPHMRGMAGFSQFEYYKRHGTKHRVHSEHGRGA